MVGVITDTWLSEIAKSMNNESFITPSYLAVGTSASILTTDTVLSSEIGTRNALTGARTGNAVTYTAIRSGAALVNPTTGDTLAVSGLMSASTNGYLLTGATHAGILQTTNFDVEFVYTITTTRNT
jgi:hypothetical protein